jgi:hypothetical protein
VPDTRYDFSVTLINNLPVPIEVETRVDGILAPTIAIRKPIRIPARGTTSVPIAVTTPAALPRPGYHTSYVFFAEKYLDEASGTIATRTEVGLSLILWEPYPGQYAELVVSAPSVPEGEDTALKVLVNNLGKEDIVDGRATVRVLAADGALQDVFTVEDIAVAGNSNEDYYDTIPSSGYNPGKYTLEGRLEYGENVSTFNGSFAVGTRDVDLIALEGIVYLDKPVNRYTVHVESLWNEPLENVYATVRLGSSESQTPSVSLPPFSRGTLTGFWETDATIVPGQTVAAVNVSFPGGSREALLPVRVEAVTPAPPVYEEPAAPTGGITLSAPDAVMLLLLVIALVLLAIWGFGKIRRGHEPPSPPPSRPGASPPASPSSPAPSTPSGGSQAPGGTR